jgi:hypothetical protein
MTYKSRNIKIKKFKESRMVDCGNFGVTYIEENYYLPVTSNSDLDANNLSVSQELAQVTVKKTTIK